jgi:signal transduction histidine kinase
MQELSFSRHRNRAEFFGGKTEIISTPGNGCQKKFTLRLVLPCRL